jgi:hypothetical protein
LGRLEDHSQKAWRYRPRESSPSTGVKAVWRDQTGRDFPLIIGNRPYCSSTWSGTPRRLNLRLGDLARIELKFRLDRFRQARSSRPNGCRVARFSWPFHRFKKEALISNEATSLSNERRSRLALGISCDHLAIPPITFFVWKGEHRHCNIGWAIISKSRKAHPNSVWGLPGNEISMMNAAIALDEHDPSARIALKRTEVAQVECVPNLTCYWVSIRHCLLRTLQFWH